MSPAYETDDSWIPAPLFDVLWARIEAIDAADQIRDAHASAHGQAMATAGDKPRVKSFTRSLHRRAFPMYYKRTGSDG